ncbi:hypothetical protein BM1_01986 [Bipolaris maydis]|nr:hypothetical protein BM1_01986 [Bipolaris maydis]
MSSRPIHLDPIPSPHPQHPPPPPSCTPYTPKSSIPPPPAYTASDANAPSQEQEYPTTPTTLPPAIEAQTPTTPEPSVSPTPTDAVAASPRDLEAGRSRRRKILGVLREVLSYVALAFFMFVLGSFLYVFVRLLLLAVREVGRA